MIRYLIIFCTFLFFVSCNNDDDSAPVQNVAPGTGIDIQTTPPTEIKSNSAISGGLISSDGGKLITERGVCWDSLPDPTILNNRTLNGEGSGVFISEIRNLNPSTKYYLRAYAKNSSGITYADQMVFSTSQLSFMQAKVNDFFSAEMYSDNLIDTIEVFSGSDYRYIDFREWENVEFSFYIFIKNDMLVNSSLDIATLSANDEVFIICFTKRNGPDDFEFFAMSDGLIQISRNDLLVELSFDGLAYEIFSGERIIVEEAKIVFTF